MDVAKSVGSPIVNSYFGTPARVDDDVAMANYAKHLSPLLSRASSMGLTIVLENEFDAFGHDPLGADISRRVRSLTELCERIDSPNFGLTLDPANIVCSGEDPIEGLHRLAPWVRHVHVKNIVNITAHEPTSPWMKYSDHGRYFSTTPIDKGLVPWPQVVSEIIELGFAGAFVLEPHCEKVFRTEAVVSSSQIFRDYLSGAFSKAV
jgi:3-dehydroshikimate dehydratase